MWPTCRRTWSRASKQIEITPPNYKFPAPSASPLLAPAGFVADTEPAAARHAAPPAVRSAVTLGKHHQHAGHAARAKGTWARAGWPRDPNGDTLVYTVEIRGANETEWKPLKDKVTEKYLSWDSTAFPDGEYRLRVTASDAPSNPPAEALTAQHRERAVPHRQHAAAHHRPDRHAQRRQDRRCAGTPPTRSTIVDQGRVFAGWRRLDRGGAGHQAFRFAGTGLRADARTPRPGSTPSPCASQTITITRRWRRSW